MPYKSLFIKLVISLVVIVAIYASIVTRCNTVLIGVFPILAFAAWYYWKKGVLFQKINSFSIGELKCLAIFVAFYVIMFLLFYFHFYKDIHGDIRSVWLDNAFYAGIADGLNQYGVEDLSYIFKNNGGMTPIYHYFEIWFYALIANLLGITSLQAMLIFGLPFLFSIALLGAYAIIVENSSLKPYLVFILAFSILFLSIGHRPLINIVKMKSIIVCIFWIWFFLEIKSKDYFNLMLPLALAAMLYNTIMPGFIVGSFIFIAILLLAKKEIKYLLPLIFIPLTFIFVFYMIKQVDSNHDNESILSITTSHYANLSNITDALSFFVTSLLSKAAEALIYLLVIYISIRGKIKEYKYPFLYILILFTVSIFGWSLLNFHVDGAQIYTNMFSPFFQIFIFYVIIIGLNSDKKYAKLLSIAILIIDIGINIQHINSRYLYTIDQKRYKEIASFIGNEKIAAAYIMDTAFYNQDIFFRNIYFEIPLKEVRLYNKFYYPECLSVYDIPPATTSMELSYYNNMIVNSDFYNYVKEHKMNDSISKAINQYLLDKNIEFLIVDKRSYYNDKLEIRATDTIVAVDKLYDITYNIYKLHKRCNKQVLKSVVN